MLFFITALALTAVSTALPVENVTRAVQGNLIGFGSGTYGGQGGSVFTVWDVYALRDALNSDQPRTIYLRGRIDLTPLFVESPGVQLSVGSYTTFLGGDPDAEIFGGGIIILGKEQVIVKYIKFNNALTYGPGELPDGNGFILNFTPGDISIIDAIAITTSKQVWVDHCEFSDDPWISDGNLADGYRRHDGLVDIIEGSDRITVSNNLFRNHNHNILLGHDDTNGPQDIGKLKVTFFGNWFKGIVQRSPRVRFGEVHVLNNLYTDIVSYGIGVGIGASVYAEKNVFINSKSPWAFPAGVPDEPGNILDQENLVINSTPYAFEIPNDVKWKPDQYYQYQALPVTEVEDYVRKNAGVLPILPQ